jgi:hypothetical protein
VSVSRASGVERLLEKFAFYGLATQQALEATDVLFRSRA